MLTCLFPCGREGRHDPQGGFLFSYKLSGVVPKERGAPATEAAFMVGDQSQCEAEKHHTR